MQNAQLCNGLVLAGRTGLRACLKNAAAQEEAA